MNAPLFQNPYYATGYPIAEAYWANVKVDGKPRDVLMQCFERRCLTYAPTNPVEWQVEMGNVGQHYYKWRYNATIPTEPPTLDGGDYRGLLGKGLLGERPISGRVALRGEHQAAESRLRWTKQHHPIMIVRDQGRGMAELLDRLVHLTRRRG